MQLEAHPVDGIRVFREALLGILDGDPGARSAEEAERDLHQPDNEEPSTDGDANQGNRNDRTEESDDGDDSAIGEWGDDEPTAVYARSPVAASPG